MFIDIKDGKTSKLIFGYNEYIVFDSEFIVVSFGTDT